VIPLGEQHLRLVREYVAHYNLERNHQGLGNRLAPQQDNHAVGPIRRRERLGGLLNFYHRNAA
jgi:putative transposase